MTAKIPVIVTTAHRGVFVGLAEPSVKSTDERIELEQAVMAIRWGTTDGLLQLANSGPTDQTKASAPANVDLCDITAVVRVTEEAWAEWQKIL